ncbi:hydrolase [Pseudoalteromonas tunicata]|uniref:hydrolase n=1 Tax=Pseudoalteromonas tunicata TaxID=314281 RepID=UPI00273D23E5|nr:hydrolase [Pseudoalteromonas tunicata]MDP4985566.1 hydrolase [Pseudoalteromonas tunicata]
MNGSFKPAWWMSNKHAQTILPRFFRPKLALNVQFETLLTPDDDFLELAWTVPAAQNNTKPLAVVFHGLEGSIDSFYAKGMMKALQKQGLDVVLMHFRNCSTHANLQPRAYHSGETSDARFLFETLAARFPSKELFAVGFSLGGNVLAKYLGEFKQNSLLKAAAVVSAPFDLASSCQVIRKSGGKIYQHYLLGRLKKSTKRKLPKIASLLNINAEQLTNINDLLEFDDRVTAPLHGFKHAEDYYQQASAKPFLQHISTPTLIVHAADDPMLSTQAIPQPQDVSPLVELHVSNKGGHVGFISGRNPFKPVFWLEQQIPAFFKRYLS